MSDAKSCLRKLEQRKKNLSNESFHNFEARRNSAEFTLREFLWGLHSGAREFPHHTKAPRNTVKKHFRFRCVFKLCNNFCPRKSFFFDCVQLARKMNIKRLLRKTSEVTMTFSQEHPLKFKNSRAQLSCKFNFNLSKSIFIVTESEF